MTGDRPDGTTRRTVLKTSGALAAAGLLAGCSSGGSTPGDGGGSDPANGGDGGGGGSRSFGGWFDDVSNYDGVVDETGASEVTVTVGAQGNGGAYAFAPAAVKVSTGTTVVWEWTGKGQSHNVVADGGGFESDMHSEEGATFEHTFEEAGTYKYYCSPHEAMGMKGAVVVA